MEAYLDALRHYADFGGRATRSQYWLYVLGLAILMVIGLIIDTVLGFPGNENVLPVTGLIWVLNILPYLAVTARRFHDVDKSAWWMLTAFVPPIGLIIYLIFTLTPSSAGANRFGPHPLGKSGTPASGPLGDRSEPQVSAPMAATAVPLDQLERLASLRASGAIDDAEFQRMKGSLLSGATH